MNEVPGTYGAEIEKPVARLSDGSPDGVDNSYFQLVQQQLDMSDISSHEHRSDVNPEVVVGINSTLGFISPVQGEQGLDNGSNLLETATPVLTSLQDISTALIRDAQITTRALGARGLGAVNMSIHPLGDRSRETYDRFAAPKGIYPYLWYRGWDHSAGIDARAQNSPSTGVFIEDAARSVSVVIGAGAAFVGIFGNSPYEEGKRSNYKESRLTMWDRMLGNSSVSGDLATSKYPERPFASLGDYYRWMFGEGTGIHFVVGEGAKDGGYKGLGNRILLVENNPSVLDYLAKGETNARYLSDVKQGKSAVHRVTPSLGHMETMQFAQFAGARIRYAFKDSVANVDIQEFVRACKGESGICVEDLLKKHIAGMWIEGRDPGTNLPDEAALSRSELFAHSMLMGPSAIQAGLLRNLSQTEALIERYGWNDLGELRQAAIKDGLDGEYNGKSVRRFAAEILEVASRGLGEDEHWMLMYAQEVISSGLNGADRAITFVEAQPMPIDQALSKLVLRRIMVLQ